MMLTILYIHISRGTDHVIDANLCSGGSWRGGGDFLLILINRLIDLIDCSLKRLQKRCVATALSTRRRPLRDDVTDRRVTITICSPAVVKGV